MGQWKLDLIFEARGRGWRETYYADFGTPNFQGMLAYAQKLAVARIAMAASPVQIKAYSVSDPITRGRQGQTFTFRTRYSAPQWPDNNGATDPSTAVNIGFINSATNATRRIQLRGCPDGIIDDFGELTGPLFGAWDGKYAAWRDILLGGGGQQGPNANYGWFSRPQVGDPGEVTYTYTPGAFAPTLSFPVNFFPDADRGQKRYIRVSGLNSGTSVLNGEMVVRVITRETATPTKSIAAGEMTTPGFAQRYATQPVFVLANNIGIEKAGRRAPGAPLGYTPGRRRARRRT